jgi:hypothetical protein
MQTVRVSDRRFLLNGSISDTFPCPEMWVHLVHPVIGLHESILFLALTISEDSRPGTAEQLSGRFPTQSLTSPPPHVICVTANATRIVLSRKNHIPSCNSKSLLFFNVVLVCNDRRLISLSGCSGGGSKQGFTDRCQCLGITVVARLDKSINDRTSDQAFWV